MSDFMIKDGVLIQYTGDEKEVIIPASVTSIGKRAFANCICLINITIPDSVTRIDDRAFVGCLSFTSITIDLNNPEYCDIDGILFSKDKTKLILCPSMKIGTYVIPDSVTSIGNRAFEDCNYLTSITIPNSVVSIGDFAFYDCASLISITIPDSVTSIGDWTFRYCTSITSINIPDSVTSIGNYAFEDCSSLTSITVDLNNPEYCDIDGVLFSKDKTKLILCPGRKAGTYVIPDSVTSIGNSAFSPCRSLTSITIPDSVTSIGNFAFLGCTSLTSITIPYSVNRIGEAAFGGCSNLNSVYIHSLESWRNILFPDDDSNPLHYAKNLYLNGLLVTKAELAKMEEEM